MLLDRTLFASPTVRVGEFRCTPDDPHFRDSGPAENHLVVFPRTGVWIRHAGSHPFVADPSVVTVYNRGQHYTRRPLCPDGDRCDWFGVAPDVAFEIARSVDPSLGGCPQHPFRPQFVRSTAVLYARQRRLFRRIRAERIDPLEIEEQVLDLVASVLRSARAGPARSGRRPGVVEQRRHLVARARAAIAADPSANTDLCTLARRLGASPYHLCRVFKAETGTTLHAYRLDLRLRLALERLESPGLTCSALAYELGFSSHSHFTAAFRRHLGRTPSEERRIAITPSQTAAV